MMLRSSKSGIKLPQVDLRRGHQTDVSPVVEDFEQEEDAESLRKEVARLRHALVAKMRGGCGKFVCGSQFKGVEQRDRPELLCKRCTEWQRTMHEAEAIAVERLASSEAATRAAANEAAESAFRANQALGREQTAKKECDMLRARIARAEKTRDDVARRASASIDRRDAEKAAEMAAVVAERDDFERRLAKTHRDKRDLEERCVKMCLETRAALERERRDADRVATLCAGERARIQLAGFVAARALAFGVADAATLIATRLAAENEALHARKPELRLVGHVCVVAPTVAIHVAGTESAIIRPPLPSEKIRTLVAKEVLPRYADAVHFADEDGPPDEDRVAAMGASIQAAVLAELETYEAFSPSNHT